MKKVSKLLAVVMAFSIMVALNVAVFATTTKTDGTKANVVNGGETVKINVLTGNENDIELGIKVKNKDLESNLNIDTAAKIAEYYDNIKKDENI